MIGRVLARITTYASLSVFAFFALFPLFWMLATATRPIPELFNIPPIWVSRNFTLKPFAEMWKLRPFPLYFYNTIVVVVGTTLLCSAVSLPASYGLSRFTFRGNKIILKFILATQMFPQILLVTPYFIMMARAGLINTHLSLILAYASFCLPFCTWVMKGFIDSIPRELDEAAFIDGYSKLRTFLRVVLPLSLPGLMTTVIFTFVVAWNHYLFALCLTTSEKMTLLSVAIPSFLGMYEIRWNHIMAASTIVVVPAVVLYIFLGKYLVSGLTAGAVKS